MTSKTINVEDAAVKFCNLRSLFTAIGVLASAGDKYDADIINLAELGGDVAASYSGECFKASGADKGTDNE